MTYASDQLESAIIRHPAVVYLDAKLIDAMAQMIGVSDLENKNATIGSSYLVIIDRGQVVGLLTERDVVRFAAQQLPIEQLTLRQILKKAPITVKESALTDLGVVLSLFQQHQLSHLPVLDERARLVGVISRESLQSLLSANLLGSRTSAKAQAWIYGQSVTAYNAAGQEMGFVGTATDISERKRAESLLEDQYQILEKIAKAEPLQDIFQAFLTAMEAYLPETACSIILCQDGHLCHPFSPSLPNAYVEAVTASVVPIAEGIGSCGTAAYRREMVISADIATDPLWQNFKHLVVPYGIKACWSMPVFGKNQAVLAVFGIYSREQGAPQPSDIEFVRKLTNLAGIAIEREQSTQALKQLNQELENRVEERTAALQSSEERWQLALKGAKDGIWDWNLETNQIFTSKRLQTIHGFKNDDFPSTIDDWVNLIHPDDREKERLAIEEHLAGKSEFFEVEYRARHQNGSYIWILSRAQAQRNALGQAVRMIGSATDITQRKKAEQDLILKRNHLEALLNNLPHMTWIKDEQSRFIAVNQPFAQVGGATTDVLVGKTDFDIWPVELAKAYRSDDFQVLQSGQRKVVEEKVARADGTMGWLETTKTPFRDAQGKLAGTVGIAADITDRKRIEAALADSESKFRRLVEGGQDLIWSTDEQGRFTYLSPQFKTLTGWEASEWIGKPCVEALHPDDQAWFAASFQALARDAIAGTMECRLSHCDHSYSWISMSTHPVLSAAGEWVGQQGTGTNITERKTTELALQDSQAHLRRLTENIPGMIFRYILHPDGSNEFTYVSPYARELYEMESEEILYHKRSPWDIVHPDDVELLASTIQQSAETLQPLVAEHRFIVPKGGLRWGQNIARPQRQENGDVVWDGVSFDITDRKQAEAQLQRTNEELIRATRMKDEFLASMSHELRTPLNAILGMTEGLQDEVFGSVNEQQSNALTTIEQSGSHLLELINEILDLAKIESGNIELTYSTVAVTHLCQASLTFVKQQSLDKGIQLHLNIPWDLPNIRVDERRIRQVLINLLNNAVKFTPTGGNVTLQVEQSLAAETLSQQYLRFSVTDSGIGIDPGELNQLFQPFVQIDSALNRQYEGTGLGLALVKRIVELHGGGVTVSSTLGVGSCFSIELPYNLANLKKPPPAITPMVSSNTPEVEPPIDAPLILIAEDNEANFMTLSSYLYAKGYRILCANNGYSAIEIAQAEVPHVILMDIQMPDLDGLVAIQRIRQLPHLKQTPIIALTAFAMEGDQARCLAAGADEYLSKPVKLKQLALLIQDLIT